jgi:hypothetical protein
MGIRSRDSSLGTAMGYGVDGHGLIPGRNVETGSGAHQASYKIGSPEVKWPERKADRCLPSRAGVKNGGAISSLPHTSSWRRT